jgi:hypothetical protein
MDKRITNKYVIVYDADENVAFAGLFTGRIETVNRVEEYNTYEDIPAEKRNYFEQP